MEHEKLIYHIINKYHLMHRVDDLYDIGLIGLVKGENTYDKAKKVKKSTYLCNCIRNEILNEVKKQNSKKRKADVISLEKQHFENLADKCDIEKDMLSQEEKNHLYSVLFRLPVYEQYVLHQIFFKNTTQKEIANHLEIKVKDVLFIKNKALQKMKELYEK